MGFTVKDWLTKILDKKNFFSSNDSRFELRSSLQVVGVPIIGLAYFIMLFSQFLFSIQSFFFAMGIESEQSIFFDYLFNQLNNQFPLLMLYFSLIFFVGSYLSILLLRPFNRIESYCHRSLEHPEAYQEFVLSGIEGKKLLTKMALHFFQFIAICRQSKVFEAQELPVELAQVKGPKIDWVFYFQYAAVLLIIALLCGAGLYFFIVDTFEAIVTLAQQNVSANSLSQSEIISKFLTHQRDYLDLIFYSTITLISFLYILLCQYIVETINGVSFAFFRSMRQIIEGKFDTIANVRFKDPGHSAVDSFNRFLDQVIPDHLRRLKNVPKENLSETIAAQATEVNQEGNDAPPPLITEEKSKNGIFYHLITQEGGKVIARSKERLLKLLSKLR